MAETIKTKDPENLEITAVQTTVRILPKADIEAEIAKLTAKLAEQNNLLEYFN